MPLGDREPAPPDLEKRHQQLSREWLRFALVDQSALLKEPHTRFTRLRALHESVVQEDMTEFLCEDPSPFLFRGESVVAVENDRALAGKVADGPSDPIEEDTLNNGHTSKVDDGFNVDRGPLDRSETLILLGGPVWARTRISRL